jgi:hypothetical protein
MTSGQLGTENVVATEILKRIARRYENCNLNIYPEMPVLTPVEAVLRCAAEEGFILTNRIPPVAQTPDTLEHTRSCPALTPMSDDDCTCGLVWRIKLQTEVKMHNAWRKRAEEAETATLIPESRWRRECATFLGQGSNYGLPVDVLAAKMAAFIRTKLAAADAQPAPEQPTDNLENEIFLHLGNACYIPYKEEQIITNTMAAFIRTRIASAEAAARLDELNRLPRSEYWPTGLEGYTARRIAELERQSE